MEFPGASGEDIEWLQNGFVSAIKVLSSGNYQPGNFNITFNFQDKVEAVKNDRYADEEEKGKVKTKA